jgi:hypothetical protein
MKPHEILRRLIEMKQHGLSRIESAPRWRSAYDDELTTRVIQLRFTSQDPDVLKRILDVLITEVARERNRNGYVSDPTFDEEEINA